MEFKAMSKVGLTVLVFGTMFLCTPVSFAQTSASGDGTESKFIQRFDKDGDGTVSKEEFPGPQDRFTKLDSNGDGVIDAGEAPTGRPHHGKGRGNIIHKFDKNGDGQVSRDEFPGPDECFASLDTNGDGNIDATEAAQTPGRPCPQWKRGGNFIQKFDKDGDGKVSKDEFPGPEERFTRLDSNGDGYIDSSETPKGGPGHGRRGPGHGRGGPGVAPDSKN